MGQIQTNGNGARPTSPWPYTAPAALALIEDLRDELCALANHVDVLLDEAESAVEFTAHRVEAARARERRRVRRGTRKALA